MRSPIIILAVAALALPSWWPRPARAQAMSTQTTCDAEAARGSSKPALVKVRGQFAAVPNGIVLFSPKCPDVRLALIETAVGIVGLQCKEGDGPGIACALAHSKGALLGTVSGMLSCKAGTVPRSCSLDVWDVNDVAQDAGL